MKLKFGERDHYGTSIKPSVGNGLELGEAVNITVTT